MGSTISTGLLDAVQAAQPQAPAGGTAAAADAFALLLAGQGAPGGQPGAAAACGPFAAPAQPASGAAVPGAAPIGAQTAAFGRVLVTGGSRPVAARGESAPGTAEAAQDPQLVGGAAAPRLGARRPSGEPADATDAVAVAPQAGPIGTVPPSLVVAVQLPQPQAGEHAAAARITASSSAPIDPASVSIAAAGPGRRAAQPLPAGDAPRVAAAGPAAPARAVVESATPAVGLPIGPSVAAGGRPTAPTSPTAAAASAGHALPEPSALPSTVLPAEATPVPTLPGPGSWTSVAAPAPADPNPLAAQVLAPAAIAGVAPVPQPAAPTLGGPSAASAAGAPTMTVSGSAPSAAPGSGPVPASQVKVAETTLTIEQTGAGVEASTTSAVRPVPRAAAGRAADPAAANQPPVPSASGVPATPDRVVARPVQDPTPVPATAVADDPAQPVVVAPMPAPQAAAVPSAPIAQAAPAQAAPSQAAPPLATQLLEPLVSLRSAPDGDHIVIVKVTPEHLGPVTVHARLSDGDLAVQLFAPSSDARDALKSMLPDLRRDLGAGAAGTSTTLGLGTGDAPQGGAPRDQGQTAGDRRGGQPSWAQPDRWTDRPAGQPAAPRPARSSSALLDVLA